MMPSFTDFLDELRSFESGIKTSAIFTNGPTGTHPDGKPNDFRSTGTISGSAEATIIPILANNHNNPSDPLYPQSQQQAHALWDAWVSGPHTADTMRALQYHSMNSLGYVGYQFGEAVMQDLGYYTADSTPNTYDWQKSAFTGVDGFTSLASMETGIQEAAILRAFGLSLHYIEYYLAHPEQSGIAPTYAPTTINQYLGQTFTADNGVQVTITVTGVLAAAHLTGWNGVINLLVNHHANVDQNGTPSTQYMNDYGGYDASFFGSTASAQIAQLLSLYRTPINQQTHATANMTAAETLWSNDFNGDGLINGQPLGGGDQTFIGNSTNQTFVGTVGGIDTVDYSSATAGVTINLGLTTAQTPGGSMGTDTLTSIENLIGSAFNDNLSGNSSVNRFTGGNGNDTLDGKGGADTMIGGDGADIYIVDNAGDVVIEGSGVNSGYDIVISTVNYTLSANVEQLVLQGGATTGTGNDTANYLYGGLSGLSLTLNGAGGDDVLYAGLAGGNTMNGGSGVDTLLLYGGNNQANGGTGSDIYYTYTASDVISEAGGDGIDTVYSNHSITIAEDIEQVILFGSATSATSASLDDNNIIYGNSTSGAVSLSGGGGADVLFGGAFNDTLSGGAGVDLLFAFGGANTLIGGDDTDVYYLESGLDTVTETLTGGFDTIYTQAAGTTALAANVEQLILYGAATGGLGNGAANYLYGHIASQAVTLDGAGGNDYLLDSAFGGDVLTGGAGNDLLDLRTGGNDFIKFAASGSNADLVYGFDANPAGGQDIIDVSGRGFSAGSIGSSIIISAAGADTLVTIGADTIQFIGVVSTDISANDFLF